MLEKLRKVRDALNNLVGDTGCLGWTKNHEHLEDAVIFRGGRLPIKSFHERFQPVLYEVVEGSIKAKEALTLLDEVIKRLERGDIKVFNRADHAKGIDDLQVFLEGYIKARGDDE